MQMSEHYHFIAAAVCVGLSTVNTLKDIITENERNKRNEKAKQLIYKQEMASLHTSLLVE